MSHVVSQVPLDSLINVQVIHQELLLKIFQLSMHNIQTFVKRLNCLLNDLFTLLLFTINNWVICLQIFCNLEVVVSGIVQHRNLHTFGVVFVATVICKNVCLLIQIKFKRFERLSKAIDDFVSLVNFLLGEIGFLFFVADDDSVQSF